MCGIVGGIAHTRWATHGIPNVENGGKLIVLTDRDTHIKPQKGTEIIRLPAIDALLTPFIYVIFLRLLAYHVAILKGIMWTSQGPGKISHYRIKQYGAKNEVIKKIFWY